MDQKSCDVVIAAEAPEALTEVCGISLLERLLRTLQRLGVDKVTIISATPEQILQHLASPSWARAGVGFDVRGRNPGPVAVNEVTAFEGRTLFLTIGYYDNLLLNALTSQDCTTLLVDSDPPPHALSLLEGEKRTAIGYVCRAALLRLEWLSVVEPDRPLFDQLALAAERRAIGVLDAAVQPSYVPSMRRTIRPLWFPLPVKENAPLAERIVLDAAQNGTLDLPAILHRPIETWIVARLCRTPITPNQITLFTGAVSAAVAVLFATGYLIAGTLLALVVGVLDGLDGKQARVKVETTPLGRNEHALDYMLELAWWTALAHHFAGSSQVPHAYAWLFLLVSSDLIDRAAKKNAKQNTGRNLDDVAPIDRFVRLIGGRRNIYVWMLGAGLLLRAADKAFVALCCCGAVTTAIHVLRAWSIGRQRDGTRSKSIPH